MKLDSIMTTTIAYLIVILIINITWIYYTAHVALLEAQSGLHTEKILTLGQIITVINIALMLVFMFCIFALHK